MGAKSPRRIRIRLPLEAYEEPGSVWHVTMCTIGRQAEFATAPLAAEIGTQIEWYSDRYNVVVHAWCLMPDHLHLIGEVTDQSILKMIGAFKSFTTRVAWRQGHSGPLWQESFYDHGLRRVEDFDETVSYSLDNPRRAGLVADPADYPWRGGSVFEGP